MQKGYKDQWPSSHIASTGLIYSLATELARWSLQAVQFQRCVFSPECVVRPTSPGKAGELSGGQP